MSTSIGIELRRKIDQEWNDKFDAVVALRKAGVKHLPKELCKFFKAHPEDGPEEIQERADESAKVWETYNLLQMNTRDLSKLPDGVTLPEEFGNGELLTIDLDQLPKSVRIIRLFVF